MQLERTSGAPRTVLWFPPTIFGDHLSSVQTVPAFQEPPDRAREPPPRRERGWPRTYVVHVLAEQVLERLAHGVALGHDPLAPVVPGAGGVGHERGPADDALQPLLQGRPEPGLAERHGVQDDLILKAVQ